MTKIESYLLIVSQLIVLLIVGFRSTKLTKNPYTFVIVMPMFVNKGYLDLIIKGIIIGNEKLTFTVFNHYFIGICIVATHNFFVFRDKCVVSYLSFFVHFKFV